MNLTEALLHPIEIIFMGDGELTILYMIIQTVCVLICYFLKKRGYIAFGSLPAHYVLGLICGHMVYVVFLVVLVMNTAFVI